MKLIKRIICFLTDHKWTSKAMKEIAPTETELKSYTGFKHYAKMYCDRCGTESKLNKRL